MSRLRSRLLGNRFTQHNPKLFIILKVCFEARHSPSLGHRKAQEVAKSHVSQKRIAAPGTQDQPLLLVSAFSKGFSQSIHMRIAVLAPRPA